MRMKESHEHGETTCAYEGVNEVNFRVIAQSSASGSSSKLFNLVSSPILANPVQSSPSIFWTESLRLSLSLAKWKSPIRMRNSYAHMRESTESLFASSLSLLLQVLRQLCESLRFIADSVFIRRSGSTPFCIASPHLDTQYTLAIPSHSHKKLH
jgi:hypothetical protein